jgi:hypothetical protein
MKRIGAWPQRGRHQAIVVFEQERKKRAPISP